MHDLFMMIFGWLLFNAVLSVSCYLMLQREHPIRKCYKNNHRR